MTVATTGAVLAHGVGGREDLPLPLGLVLQGSAVALLVSFLALGLLWRSPRLRGSSAGRPLPAAVRRAVDSAWLRWALRVAGLAATAYAAVAAVFGKDDSLNPTPYVVYVLFWIGIVPASVVFGPVWRHLNPLRTLHVLLSRACRVDPDRGLLPLPPAVGYWPAAVSLFSFVWLELVAPDNASMPVLRTYFAVYAGAHLVAAILFGSRWFAAGDGFEVYSTLVGKLSPFGRRDDGMLVIRNPLDGVATLGPAPGLVAVIAVALGSTAFDSLSGSPAWIGITQSLPVPGVLVATVGLLAMINVVATTYAMATIFAGRLGQQGRDPIPGMLAHSIVPIIVGYVIAHYFSSLVFQGQQAFILLSDPLGIGANLLGTALRGVDYTLVGPLAIALVQVVAVVGGHILAVVSAHDRAVALFPPRQAVAGQLPLLVLMVTYTVGGLSLLFAA